MIDNDLIKNISCKLEKQKQVIAHLLLLDRKKRLKNCKSSAKYGFGKARLLCLLEEITNDIENILFGTDCEFFNISTRKCFIIKDIKSKNQCIVQLNNKAKTIKKPTSTYYEKI